MALQEVIFKALNAMLAGQEIPTSMKGGRGF